MTDKELMQQALDALESVFEGDDKGAEYWTVTGGTYEAVECMNAMRALRARLAQPEPAQCDGGQCGIGGYCKECPKTKPEPEPEKSQDKPCVEDDGCPTEKAVLQRFWREHQAQPEREWVGLTDAEAMEIEDTSPDIRWAIIQAEAKLKEKNT